MRLLKKCLRLKHKIRSMTFGTTQYKFHKHHFSQTGHKLEKKSESYGIQNRYPNGRPESSFRIIDESSFHQNSQKLEAPSNERFKREGLRHKILEICFEPDGREEGSLGRWNRGSEGKGRAGNKFPEEARKAITRLPSVGILFPLHISASGSSLVRTGSRSIGAS